MLTDADLDAIEQRCNAATPGPWTVLSLPLVGKVVITPAGDGVETVEEARP